MATWKHPLVDVELNTIDIHRAALNRKEATLVHILKHEGWNTTDVAQLLGTNPARVCDVIDAKEHVGSATDAMSIIAMAPLRRRRQG
jgi:hypothetical protein